MKFMLKYQEKASNYYTFWFPFTYKSLLKNTQFYIL